MREARRGAGAVVAECSCGVLTGTGGRCAVGCSRAVGNGAAPARGA